MEKRIDKFKIIFEEEFGNAVTFHQAEETKAESKDCFMAFLSLEHALFAFIYLDILEVQAEFIKEEEMKRI